MLVLNITCDYSLCYRFLTYRCEACVKNHLAFLEPVSITPSDMITSTPEEAEAYIKKALKKFKNNKTFIVIPFYERKHWILIVILPQFAEVWYLNSVSTFTTSEEMRELIGRYVDSCLENFICLKGFIHCNA